MDKTQVLDALKQLKANSSKRNFKQRVDLILPLKNLDMKKTDNQITSYITLHYTTGKKTKVCALIGPELLAQAKEVCDEAISLDDFPKYDKKAIKKLAETYDFFIAQATVMPKVAATFGRIFGPKGKMPNPKAGCVVPPNANLKPLYDKLQKTIKIQTGNQPLIQCAVGSEDMKEEEISDNVLLIHESVSHLLPQGKHNIRKALLKLTMGHPVKVGAKAKEEKKAEKSKKKKEKPNVKKEETKSEEKPKKQSSKQEAKEDSKEPKAKK
jgi:large subunit ribosomal protein L1